MIKISLTVADALALATQYPLALNGALYDKIVNAFVEAVGENKHRKITITHGMNMDNRIRCIKAIRSYTGWGLKESKDWTDVITGHYDSCGWWVNGGNTNSLTLETAEKAESLLRELTSFGCEGYLS